MKLTKDEEVIDEVVAEVAAEDKAVCDNCGDSGKACIECHAGDLVE